MYFYQIFIFSNCSKVNSNPKKVIKLMFIFVILLFFIIISILFYEKQN